MGRSQRFLDHWHPRELVLPDGDRLTWTLISDPRHVAPHAEFGRVTAVDGESRLLHPSELQRLLLGHEHVDAEHVRVETHGRTFTH